MMGAAEKAGSGVDKIRHGWNSQHWRSPMVKERTQPDRVLWILPMISLIPDESLVRLKQRFGTKFQGFTGLEIQALVTADLEEWVDNARMRQITSHHSADMTKLLQKLAKEGSLIQDGQGRWTRYRLPLESDFPHKEFHPPHKTELSNVDQDELIRIAEPARENPRLPPKELISILLKLCDGRWLTRKHIAELLNRSDEGLRYRFLVPLVKLGHLRMRYPDKPSRVDQAYIKNVNAVNANNKSTRNAHLSS